MTIFKEKKETLGAYMTLGGHIEDFRKRLIYILLGIAVGIIICLFFGNKLIFFTREPYVSVMIKQGLEPRLQTLAPSDGFITYIKISILAGFTLASPWVFYHLWRFVAAGLYVSEKRVVGFAVPISTLLFVSGVVFFIIVVAPFTLRFFIIFNKKMLGVDSAFTFEKYISFIINMMLVFGFAFQTPTAIFFLNKIGVVSLEKLSKSRKYVLFAIFIIASITTPPDVVSQLTLAVPLYLLFELGILLSYFANR
ncbi:MAG: twin-arginine translocase subunit TatC [Planctomycetota bacterium]|jgi:sec-independent protein translocase protein TatC